MQGNYLHETIVKAVCFTNDSLTKCILAVVICLIFTQQSHADEASLAAENESSLQKVFGEREFVVEQHDDYLSEIRVGSDIFFMTPDARYIFAGPVFDTRLMQDISILRKNAQRQAYLRSHQNSQFIQYPSKHEKYVVTVFTDIGCPFCRKMHQYMDEFNQLGISIRYVMVPSGAPNAANYQQTLWALCSENAAEAVNQAMANIALTPQDCEGNDLLVRQQEMVQALKITNTPSIVLPSGELRLGLMSPEQMLELITRSN